VATRRARVLVAAAVLGCLLVPVGVALGASGVRGDHDGRTVLGIAVAVGGLACLRVLPWVRRVRSMTEAGRALHAEKNDR
jgi:hypothetical protein